MNDVPLAPEEFERRKLAWDILSRMFLDTEFDREQYVEWGKELASTNFSRAELWTIFADELAPVLYVNAWAWVWDGFDQEWLQGQILSRKLINPKPTPVLTPLRRCAMTFLVFNHWRQLIRHVEASRSTP